MSIGALTRPFSLKALPGLVLAAIPIVEFFSMGYKMACASTAMRNIRGLPGWQNWTELFLFGLKARVIQLIWLAPAIITYLLIFFQLNAKSFDLQATLGIKNLFILFIIFLVIGLVFMPASILNFVTETRFKGAFSFSMLKRMFSKAYLFGWLASFTYAIIVMLILIFIIFLLGNLQEQLFLASILILPIELFFLWFPGVTIWTLFGEAWGKALQREYLVSSTI